MKRLIAAIVGVALVVTLTVSCGGDDTPNKDMMSKEYSEFQEWKEMKERINKKNEIREIVYEILWEMGSGPYWAYDEPYYPDPYYPEPRMMPVEPDGGIGDTPKHMKR